jgi:hypothetical protein
MLAQQKLSRGLIGHVPFWSLAAVGCLVLGYVLGQPRVKPYLLEILLLSVAVCLAFLAVAAVYIFLKPAKRSDAPNSIAYACAVALLLVALFFVGKWMSMA